MHAFVFSPLSYSANELILIRVQALAPKQDKCLINHSKVKAKTSLVPVKVSGSHKFTQQRVSNRLKLFFKTFTCYLSTPV